MARNRFAAVLAETCRVAAGPDAGHIAIDRPSLTWRCSDTGDLQSIVTVTFEPHEDRATLMRITHSTLPATLVRLHLDGWRLVAGQRPGSSTARPLDRSTARPLDRRV
jgi:hypothetical protein